MAARVGRGDALRPPPKRRPPPCPAEPARPIRRLGAAIPACAASGADWSGRGGPSGSCPAGSCSRGRRRAGTRSLTTKRKSTGAWPRCRAPSSPSATARPSAQPPRSQGCARSCSPTSGGIGLYEDEAGGLDTGHVESMLVEALRALTSPGGHARRRKAGQLPARRGAHHGHRFRQLVHHDDG